MTQLTGLPTGTRLLLIRHGQGAYGRAGAKETQRVSLLYFLHSGQNSSRVNDYPSDNGVGDLAAQGPGSHDRFAAVHGARRQKYPVRSRVVARRNFRDSSSRENLSNTPSTRGGAGGPEKILVSSWEHPFQLAEHPRPGWDCIPSIGILPCLPRGTPGTNSGNY